MNDQNNRSEFDEWAIVEIMGRKVFAGRVRDSTIGGAPMLRIDVPEAGDQPAYTKYFGSTSIYAITPTDEATARAMAQRLAEPPIERWIIPQAGRALPEPDSYPDDDDLNDWGHQMGFNLDEF